MLTQGFNNIVGCVVLRKKVFNAYRNETPGTEECRTEASPQSLTGQCITQILGVGPTCSHHTVDCTTFINPDNKELVFSQGTSISMEYEQSFFQWANSSNNKLAET